MTRVERVRQASRHRREQEKQELRQAIIDAAADLFLEQGYDRFSLRQVAEQIGYSPTTIYLYFQDKDDLLFTIVDYGFERFEQQLALAAQSTEDTKERLYTLCHAYVDFGLQNQVYYQLMFMQRADFLMKRREGELMPRYAAFMVLQLAVQEAIDADVLRQGSAESYSDTLWALVHGIVSLAISMPVFNAARIKKATNEALKMIFNGLGHQ